jgi:hypothetical protein
VPALFLAGPASDHFTVRRERRLVVVFSRLAGLTSRCCWSQLPVTRCHCCSSAAACGGLVSSAVFSNQRKPAWITRHNQAAQAG